MENKTKKLNFSSIHESVLQRYVFEKLSFGKINEKKDLLPIFLKERVMDLIAIVPESILGEHRADFVLIFKNGQKINLEIEWKCSLFNHKIDYYKENRGM